MRDFRRSARAWLALYISVTNTTQSPIHQAKAEHSLQSFVFHRCCHALRIVLSKDAGRSTFKLTRTDGIIAFDLLRDSRSHDQLNDAGHHKLRFALDMLELTRFLTVAASWCLPSHTNDSNETTFSDLRNAGAALHIGCGINRRRH